MPTRNVPKLIDVQKHSDFDEHKSVYELNDKKTGLKAYVAIHRKNPAVPSFGATRFWHYASDAEALQDALRLSRIMSYKAALAGLPCGGAKGVIIAPVDIHNRAGLLESYAEQINLLGGQFITGTDVGLTQEDIPIMKARSPHIIGLNNNSTECTARGIDISVKVCLQEVFETEKLVGKSVAIQGLGKIGSGLLRLLAQENVQVYISDLNKECLTAALNIMPSAIVTSPEKIYGTKVDIFSPNALGCIINKKTVKKFSCRIIAGGANDQLEDESMGAVLQERGILYAPDYVVNAGGLIAVFDEYQYGASDQKRLFKRVEDIKERLQSIFAQAKEKHLPTNIIADRLAEKIFNGYH
jgi:leucine dehydrogenase